MELSRENASAVRHLQVHQRPVPVLQTEHATLAELAPAQPVVQRLFRENPADARPTGQGRVLGTAPGRPGHVRERFAVAAPQAVQADQVRQRQIGQRADRSGQQFGAHAAQPPVHVGGPVAVAGRRVAVAFVGRVVRVAVVVAVFVVGRQPAAAAAVSTRRRRRGRRWHDQAAGQETVRHREPDRTRSAVAGRTAAAAGRRGLHHGRRRRRRGRRGRRHPPAVPVHRAGRVPGCTARGTVRVPSRGRGRRGVRVPRPPSTTPRAAPQPAATVAPPSPTTTTTTTTTTTLFTVRRGVLSSAQLILQRVFFILLIVRAILILFLTHAEVTISLLLLLLLLLLCGHVAFGVTTVTRVDRPLTDRTLDSRAQVLVSDKRLGESLSRQLDESVSSQNAFGRV